MANKPFDYTIINPLERPTSTDINQLQAQAHYDLRQFAYEIFGRQNGFLGYSFNPEPNSPADGTFYIQQGVAFQYGAAENSFGSPTIPGLVDSYRQKAVTTINRQITAGAVPSAAGEKRYDLLMIRAPASDERLTDLTSVGVYTPSFGTFEATSKYKTLTSSLDGFVVESITSVQTPTDPIVYKSGNVFMGAWNPANKPSVDVGYLGVAYIQRYAGQTEIVAGDIEDARTLLTVPVQTGGSGNFDLPAGEILLGNGTSGIASTAILPVSKGGTGNGSPGAFMGSVAYYDDSTDQLKYSQAIKTFVPRTGWLLASNSTGGPTWIEPGTAGLPLVSTGTEWEAAKVPTSGRTGTSASGIYQDDIDEQLTDTSYQLLNVTPTPATFSIVGGVPYTVSFLPGAASPWDGEFAVENKSAIQLNTVSVKIEIYSGASVIRQWVFNYRVPALQWRTLSPLAVTDVRPSDYANCTVQLSIKSDYANDIWYTINNMYFFFAQ